MGYKWCGVCYKDIFDLASRYCDSKEQCSDCYFLDDCPLYFREGVTDKTTIKNFIDGIGGSIIDKEEGSEDKVENKMEDKMGDKSIETTNSFMVSLNNESPRCDGEYLVFLIDRMLKGRWDVLPYTVGEGWYGGETVLYWGKLPEAKLNFSLSVE